MRDDIVQDIQCGLLVFLLWIAIMFAVEIKLVHDKLDALQQTTTVEDAPASGGEGA